MINHFFTVLYNRTEATSAGIYVPLTAALVVPDAVAGGLAGLRGATQASAESFALQALKLVDASSYRGEIFAVDPRVTYRIDEIGADVVDSSDFVAALLAAPGSLIAAAVIPDADIYKTYSTAPMTLERCAAIIVGVVRQITKTNG